MFTDHQYLDRYPVQLDSRLLILGTIHPHNTGDFKIPFFYGNKNSIWNLLSDAFPKLLPKPIVLENVLSFLQHGRISLSDTIRQCRRLRHTALDTDLVPEILNYELIDQIKESQIEQILCTSGFGKNNAFRLFYEGLLGLKITPEIRAKREVLLPDSIFGRPVLVKALYSPSGSSNISFSRHPLYVANKDKYASFPNPVYTFKVDYYRTQFAVLDLQD
ncbi:hypothetical protein [Sphingobacterium psychroaquaticum]|uniref:G/U mismatch-specific uracil-DNA glycosylase n=1 Tax=Sphingobacterium psychroaquaticum TaxID=561061 RepID=A0A1X7IJ95_9SPHI|nr:hypothetical protein [Sphingobacterium psychroaquaticum]SMG14376.1 hypothetical protein SAMN05660862_0863 [Sphingobacterium psychroaquaticum]